MINKRFVGWFCLFTLFCSTLAQAEVLIPAPPQIAASSYVLMDSATGEVIIEHNAHEPLPPASLTKMMTAYLVEREIARGEIDPDEEAFVSIKAWKTGGSKMFIREGTKVPVIDLLRGVIIQSGNDASIALAEHVAGSEDAFADLMNKHAERLGLRNSHFMNATGLPAENHYSSAYDMAVLAKHIIEDYPEHYAIYAEKHFTYNKIRQPNRNKLLWRDPSVDGLKTGHTEAAGYCLVASAKQDGMRLISAVMGTNSEEARARESQKLLNYGFRYYETADLYSAGQQLHESRIWGGASNQLKLGVENQVKVTLPKGAADSLAASINVDEVIKAPVAAGQELGRLLVQLDGETIVDQPLIALQSVEAGGFFKRLWDAISLFFSQLFS